MLSEQISLSKLEVAERQLETAIDLFFNDQDPISIHTLVAASHQILHDLSGLEGKESFLKDTAPGFLTEKYKPKFIKAIRNAQNFFKHADRDAGEKLDFNPEHNVFYLFDSIDLYEKLTGKIFIYGRIFRYWFYCNYPELLTETVDVMRSQFLGSIGMDDPKEIFEYFKEHKSEFTTIANMFNA